MWFVLYALKRPYSMGALALLIIIFGLYAIKKLPIDILPNVDTPNINVIWTYNGLNAREMSSKITSFSEIAMMNNVDNIREISSETFGGVAVIKIQFQETVNIELALSQVTSISQSILRRMPQGTTPPIVVRSSQSAKPVMSLVISSDRLSGSQLSDFSRLQLRSQIQSIGGVRLSLPYGGASRQIMIDLNPSLLAQLRLTPQDVSQALARQNQTLPSGVIRQGTQEIQIAVDASPENVASFRELPIIERDGQIIKLRDVANVRDGDALQSNIVRVNGQNAVLVSLIKIGDASTVDIIKQVKERLPDIQKTAPDGVVIEAIFDQSVFVTQALNTLTKEIILVGGLVALIVFLFLASARSSLIVMASIPLSLLVAIGALHLTGHTLNVISLGGLALAVGILVDNALVEIENINRNIDKGLTPVDATIQGAKEIAFAEFVSTLSICVVFAPIFLLSGTSGYIFEPLAIVVITALISSYVLSRTIIPTLAALYLKPKSSQSHGFKSVEALLDRLTQAATKSFYFLKAHFKKMVLVYCLLLALAFVFFKNSARIYFPQTDAGLLKLYVQTPPGTRLEQTSQIFAHIQKTITEIIPAQDLKKIVEMIGQPEAVNLAWVDSLMIGSFDGELLIELSPDAKSTFVYQEKIIERLKKDFPELKFIFQYADITNQTLADQSQADLNIRIMGRDFAGNNKIARDLSAELAKDPLVKEWLQRQVNNLPEYLISIDRDRAMSLGITPTDAIQALLTTLGSGGTVAPSFWSDPQVGISYTVQIQTPMQFLTSADDLMRIPLRSANGEMTTLGVIASIVPKQTSANVARTTLQPTINLLVNSKGEDLQLFLDRMRTLIEPYELQLKPGNRIELSGQAQTMENSFQHLGAGLIASVILIIIIMVFNFQSWLMPLIALSALPIALLGSLSGLLLTQTALSIPAYMGFIMIIGVSTANTVLFTTFARDAWLGGLSADDAAAAAIKTRLRPILMTATTMVIGLLPMAMALGEGSEQNAPLARAVIGGLITGTFATLYLVPLIFARALRHKQRPISLLEGRHDVI